MFLLFVFLFGLIIGSFLNVVVARLERESLSGRSKCVHCGHQLKWFELFPVISFLGLMGKCRYCRKSISFQYPLVEISTAFLFLFNVIVFGVTASAFINLIIIGLLIVIVAYDILHFLLPTNLVLAVGVFGLIYAFLNNYWLGALAAGALWLLVFWTGWVLSRGRAVGIGDANLMLALTLWLGASASFSLFVVAVWLGAILGLLLILGSKLFKSQKLVTMKSKLPFAPFLVFGAFLTLFYDLNLWTIFFH